MIRAERDGEGRLWLRRVTPFHADTLVRIPSWLESSDPRVRERLLPETYDEDDAKEVEWRRLVGPELEHLFASRTEILRRDLATLEQDTRATFKLRIGRGHEHAWLSGLNGARHALFALHGLTEADMQREPVASGDPEKELALVRIHIMALVQELLLQAG